MGFRYFLALFSRSRRRRHLLLVLSRKTHVERRFCREARFHLAPRHTVVGMERVVSVGLRNPSFFYLSSVVSRSRVGVGVYVG